MPSNSLDNYSCPSVNFGSLVSLWSGRFGALWRTAMPKKNLHVKFILLLLFECVS